MNAFNFLLVLLTELCSVTGQIFFKRAVLPNQPAGSFTRFMSIGIAVKSIDFFLWAGLLNRFDLSYLYPFESLNRVMLLVGASLFLKEKASLTLWAGVLMISAGVALVSASS